MTTLNKFREKSDIVFFQILWCPGAISEIKVTEYNFWEIKLGSKWTLTTTLLLFFFLKIYSLDLSGFMNEFRGPWQVLKSNFSCI